MPSEREADPDAASGLPSDGRVVAHPVAASDEALGGVGIRLTHEFLLRTVYLLSRISDGDLLEGLVMVTIIYANIGHLDRDPATSGQYLGVEDVVPDELRRPVSVLAIASSLNLPYETARRYVHKNVKAGRCRRVKGGLIAIGDSLLVDRYSDAIRTNMINVRHFCAGLRRVGIKID
jgi:hypothetical protein